MTDMQYVVNSTGKLRRVLLCPPTYFEFQPINEITRKVLANGEEPDLDVLRREHEEFADAHRSAGVEVELIEPVENLPYMVYARDFGACLAEGPRSQVVEDCEHDAGQSHDHRVDGVEP